MRMRIKRYLRSFHFELNYSYMFSILFMDFNQINYMKCKRKAKNR